SSGVDAGQRLVDLGDGLLQVAAAALRDRVGHGLRALCECLLPLTHGVFALGVQQAAETVPGAGGRGELGVEGCRHADLLGATREDAVTGWWRVRTGGCDSGRESGELRRRPILAATE